jgi:ubiquitin C-terminal hydrolase
MSDQINVEQHHDICIPIEVSEEVTTNTESYNLLDHKSEENPFTNYFATLQRKHENTVYAILVKLNDFNLILDGKSLTTEERELQIEKNDSVVKFKLTLYTIQVEDIVKFSFRIDFIKPQQEDNFYDINNININSTEGINSASKNKEVKRKTNPDDIVIDIEYCLLNNIKNNFSKMMKRKVNITETNFFQNEGWADYENLVLNSQTDPLILKIRFTCPGKNVETCTKYNGLHNEGNTCYMNSIIQCLYHINILKKLIFKLPVPEDNPIFALQNIFWGLQSGDMKTVDLFEAMKMEKSEYNSQQDVQEMFSVLLDLIGETYLKLMDENSFTTFFEGSLMTKIECKDIEYVSHKSEGFLFLGLDIEYSENLYQCIENYLSVETLRDENQYECEGTLRDAIRYSVFEKIPKILLVQLKRFKYTEDYLMQKVHSRMEYPEEIDMSRYYAFKMDKSGRHEYPDDLLYSLYAVIVHQGQIDSGHYFIYVKEYESQRWVKLNDKCVTYVNESEVFELNYGSEYDDISINELHEVQVEKVTNDRSAYILVYVQKDQQHMIFEELKQGDVNSIVKYLDTRSIARTNQSL